MPEEVDVLLLNPGVSSTDNVHEMMPPLGILWIGALLERHEFTVKVIDFQLQALDPRKALSHFDPKLIGVGGTSLSRFVSFDLARTCKELFPEVPSSREGGARDR